jgi:crossover junction endodeoxyribonuclease RuvC
MPDLFIGVDPGLSGAIAFFDPSEDAVDVFDMPLFQIDRNGKKKHEIDVFSLAQLIDERQRGQTVIRLAVIEKVGSMPKQGVASSFTFGVTWGIALGVVGAHFIRTERIIPRTWQAAMEVKDGKDGARARAMQLFPKQSKLFARVKDDGRADASLMAAYGYKLWRQK